MNEPPFHHYNRRWYDGISNMTLALLVSQKLPVEIQAMIASNLNRAINDSRKNQRRNHKQAVSMGQQHVLGLHKSGRRLRWYDPDPAMHRAFSFMSIVPEPYLAEFAERVIKVGHYLNQQRVLYPAYYQERLWLADTVEGILDERVITFSESSEGFRLVGDQLSGDPLSGEPFGSDPSHPRHVLPAPKRKHKGS